MKIKINKSFLLLIRLILLLTRKIQYLQIIIRWPMMLILVIIITTTTTTTIITIIL
jgi:hypothetical protein